MLDHLTIYCYHITIVVSLSFKKLCTSYQIWHLLRIHLCQRFLKLERFFLTNISRYHMQ